MGFGTYPLALSGTGVYGGRYNSVHHLRCTDCVGHGPESLLRTHRQDTEGTWPESYRLRALPDSKAPWLPVRNTMAPGYAPDIRVRFDPGVQPPDHSPPGGPHLSGG